MLTLDLASDTFCTHRAKRDQRLKCGQGTAYPQWAGSVPATRFRGLSGGSADCGKLRARMEVLVAVTRRLLMLLVVVARWLLVLPVSLIVGELAWGLFYCSTWWLIGRPDWFLEYAAYGLWMGALTVYVAVSTAAYIAPARKTATAMILAVGLFTLYLLYAVASVPVLLSNITQWSFTWYTSELSLGDPTPFDLLSEDLAPFRGISGLATATYLITQMWRGKLDFDPNRSRTSGIAGCD